MFRFRLIYVFRTNINQFFLFIYNSLFFNFTEKTDDNFIDVITVIVTYLFIIYHEDAGPGKTPRDVDFCTVKLFIPGQFNVVPLLITIWSLALI